MTYHDPAIVIAAAGISLGFYHLSNWIVRRRNVRARIERRIWESQHGPEWTNALRYLKAGLRDRALERAEGGIHGTFL